MGVLMLFLLILTVCLVTMAGVVIYVFFTGNNSKNIIEYALQMPYKKHLLKYQVFYRDIGAKQGFKIVFYNDFMYIDAFGTRLNLSPKQMYEKMQLIAREKYTKEDFLKDVDQKEASVERMKTPPQFRS